MYQPLILTSIPRHPGTKLHPTTTFVVFFWVAKTPTFAEIGDVGITTSVDWLIWLEHFSPQEIAKALK